MEETSPVKSSMTHVTNMLKSKINRACVRCVYALTHGLTDVRCIDSSIGQGLEEATTDIGETMSEGVYTTVNESILDETLEEILPRLRRLTCPFAGVAFVSAKSQEPLHVIHAKEDLHACPPSA